MRRPRERAGLPGFTPQQPITSRVGTAHHNRLGLVGSAHPTHENQKPKSAVASAPNQRCRRIPAGRSAGFTLVETMVAGIILAAVVTLSAQMLAALAKQQRDADRRQLAAVELANVMERVTSQAYESITSRGLKQIKLSEQTRQRLPQSNLKLNVADQTGPLTAKRITADIRWKNRAGQFVAPVRLVTWVYHPQERGK